MKKYEQYGGLKNQKEEYYSSTGDLAKLLIASGADVNKANKASYSVLMKASELGKTELVKALIDGKADVNYKSKSNKTALTEAVNGKGNAEIIKMLVNSGADVNQKTFYTGKQGTSEIDNNEGVFATPLIIAILKNNVSKVKALTDSKASLNDVVKFNKKEVMGTTALSTTWEGTALNLAADLKYQDILTVLKDAGALGI